MQTANAPDISDVVLRKEVVPIRTGVEQVHDFVWGGVALGKIPILLDRTVHRWKQIHADMAVNQVRRYLAINTCLRDFEFLLQWGGAELMLSADAGTVSTHRSCLPMTLSLGKKSYPLITALVGSHGSKEMNEILERGVRDFQKKYDFLRQHFELPELSLQDAIDVGLVDRGLFSWMEDVVDAGWVSKTVPEPEHRNHISSKKASGLAGKKVAKLCYNFIVGNDKFLAWALDKHRWELKGVWVTPCGKIRFMSLAATAYSLLIRPTNMPTNLLQLVMDYLVAFPSVMYSDTYEKKPNQWRRLGLLLQDEAQLLWLHTQAELYRIFFHAISVIARSISKHGFKSMKSFWLALVAVVSRNLSSKDFIKKAFISKECDVFGVVTEGMIRTKETEGGQKVKVRFVGNQLDVEIERPWWAPEEVPSYVGEVVKLLLAAEGQDMVSLPTLMTEPASTADHVFNGVVNILTDVQREVDVYARKLETAINPEFDINAHGVETPVRICKDVIDRSCGTRITDLCLRGCMVCRSYEHWAPRDELWQPPFIEYAKKEFALAEGSLERSLRIGAGDTLKEESRTRNLTNAKRKREETEARVAQIERISCRDMVQKLVGKDFLVSQAEKRGLKKTGNKKELFERLMDYDKKANCDDLPEGEIDPSFYERGKKAKQKNEDSKKKGGEKSKQKKRKGRSKQGSKKNKKQNQQVSKSDSTTSRSSSYSSITRSSSSSDSSSEQSSE